jgi:hypothetical protein
MPANPVGLILAGFGLSFAIGVIGESLAAIESPLTAWGVWFGTWQWAVGMALILVQLPLRFPDGRLLSTRYRWVTPVMFIGLAGLIFGNAFKESTLVSTLEGDVLVGLPLGLPLPIAVFDVAALVGLAFMLAAVGGAVVSAVMRFRRSTGVERQQMKLFAGALSISIMGMALNLVLYETGNEAAANAVFAIWVLVLVSSIAVAVLRYRLYDIDRVVSRTASYTLLVLILAAVYLVGAVWLPTQIVGEQSPLFVAGSTLAVAALFTPIRRRVMTWVDRRFYRSRYQMERVIHEFSSHLQDEVDPDQMVGLRGSDHGHPAPDDSRGLGEGRLTGRTNRIAPPPSQPNRRPSGQRSSPKGLGRLRRGTPQFLAWWFLGSWQHGRDAPRRTSDSLA